ATSSPYRLIDVIVDKLNIRSYFSAFSSAEHLEFGKPHPQVYLDCAASLQSKPVDCICFEDSFYGMIAAKSARMRCVVIPHMDVRDQLRFRAADHLLHSLHDFTKEMLA
ncbi:MAG: HAD-IA family hydrolase, partial [Sphingobacteriales bacterium]